MCDLLGIEMVSLTHQVAVAYERVTHLQVSGGNMTVCITHVVLVPAATSS